MLGRSFLQHSRRRKNQIGRVVLVATVSTSAFLVFSPQQQPMSTAGGANGNSSNNNSRKNVTAEKRKISVHAVRGPRASMEDRWYISDDLKFFAVYDGHGGHRVAEQAQKLLYDEFVKELEGTADKEKKTEQQPGEAETEAVTGKENSDFVTTVGGSTITDDPQNVQLALVRGFDTVSKKILASTYLDLEGSTAVVVYLCEDNIVAANLGDSRAIVCRGPRALPLTTDHKPDSSSEKKRIEDLGGKVKWHGYLGPDKLPVPGMGAYRINGNLAVSRALGDRLERPFVSSEPDLTIMKRNKDEDRFVVLASDGLWDVMTSQDVVDFVRQILAGSMGNTPSSSGSQVRSKMSTVVPFVSSSAKKTDAIRNEMDKRQESMAQFIAEEALRRGSADNVTVLVVWLR